MPEFELSFRNPKIRMWVAIVMLPVLIWTPLLIVFTGQYRPLPVVILQFGVWILYSGWLYRFNRKQKKNVDVNEKP
ncbi:hypothetical protein AB1K83_18035 [Sporosarcina sp. 179-K 3D1 HS]|uniref:hypothetical protein n=1 Tax=Sporosarcina sp. 179-K 3D1 HS TaxID=3232169 RepID=UPI00399FCDB5